MLRFIFVFELLHMFCFSKVPGNEVVDLLKWEFDTVHKYFHGITGRRWIPRPEALELAQCCHDMTDSC